MITFKELHDLLLSNGYFMFFYEYGRCIINKHPEFTIEEVLHHFTNCAIYSIDDTQNNETWETLCEHKNPDNRIMVIYLNKNSDKIYLNLINASKHQCITITMETKQFYNIDSTDFINLNNAAKIIATETAIDDFKYKAAIHNIETYRTIFAL